MKKSLFITILFLISIHLIVSEQIDNIVLLDTSESMFPYYSGTIDYLIEDIVQQQLEPGDTFHLLSFNDFPEYEISRTIRNESEMQDILKRILLLQPIGKYTDLISAFSFLYEYTGKLQLNSIKRIIILTDGIHDPPPESPYPISPDNSNDIIKISQNMKKQGWNVTLVKFPQINIDNNKQGDSNTVDDIKSTGDKTNFLGIIADELDGTVIIIDKKGDGNTTTNIITGAPEIEFPGDLGTVGHKFKADFKIINHSSDSVLLKLTAIKSIDNVLLHDPLSIQLDPEETKNIELILELPDNIKEGRYSNNIELLFDDSYRAYPRKGNLNYYFDPTISDIKNNIDTRFILYIILGIIVLIILAYILVAIYRNIGLSGSSSEKSVNTIDGKKTYTSGTPKIKARYADKNRKEVKGQIAIEMVVQNQNRQIGHRNIHFIEESHPLSVGGAGSEYFLIFIIATGKRIGEIVMEKGVVSFVPKDKDFFPDLAGNKLNNCLSIPIKIVNKTGIETFIIFNEWISPVERLNRIMHLLDKKGLPDFRY